MCFHIFPKHLFSNVCKCVSRLHEHVSHYLHSTFMHIHVHVYMYIHVHVHVCTCIIEYLKQVECSAGAGSDEVALQSIVCRHALFQGTLTSVVQ